MTLLSDGALKVYGTCAWRGIEEFREHQVCSMEAARNQHVTGHIEAWPFWPCVKGRRDQDDARHRLPTLKSSGSAQPPANA